MQESKGREQVVGWGEATALGGAHKLVFLVSTPSEQSTSTLPTVCSQYLCNYRCSEGNAAPATRKGD